MNTTSISVLGYDPWDFPVLQNPRRDIAYFTFGWAIYEFIECVTVLLTSRAKWRSGVFQSIVTATVFQLVAVLLATISYSSSKATDQDFYQSPKEFGIRFGSIFCVLVARLAYIWATITITLAVFPRNKLVITLVYTFGILAALGGISFTCLISHFWRMQLDQYYIYMKTMDVAAVNARITENILPFIPPVQIGSVIETVTMMVFIVLTKTSFIWEILRSLNVPFWETVRVIVTTKSTQRIFSSTFWSIVETSISLTIGPSDLTMAMIVFSMMYQITTLALLAFEGSVKIVKTHTMATPKSHEKSGSKSTGQSAKVLPSWSQPQKSTGAMFKSGNALPRL